MATLKLFSGSKSEGLTRIGDPRPGSAQGSWQEILVPWSWISARAVPVMAASDNRERNQNRSCSLLLIMSQECCTISWAYSVGYTNQPWCSVGRSYIRTWIPEDRQHWWRRKWQPTPVFLPGESQGRGAWWAAVSGVAESDMTEATQRQAALGAILETGSHTGLKKRELKRSHLWCPICNLWLRLLSSWSYQQHLVEYFFFLSSSSPNHFLVSFFISRALKNKKRL